MRVGVLCGLVLSFSCGPTPSGVDAGSLPDAGVTTDAGAAGAADAGSTSPDAGVVDAGPGIVAGQAWGNLQHPPFFTSSPGASTPVYGRLWIDGRTPAAGATPGVSAELGFGPVGSDPATDARWTWVAAAFNLDVGNNDEFRADLVAPASGVFDFAFRYRLESGGRWSYADRSDEGRVGTDDGYQSENAGRLAVRAPGAALKVATQNLHCLDASPATRLETAATRYAQLGVDAVTLQEVCVDGTLGNTAEVLAARLRVLTSRPWRHFFVETHLANGTTSEGVGVVTALPVVKTSTLDLPTVSFARKSLQVLAASEVGIVSLSTEHFSFEATPAGVQDRLDQVDAVLAFEQAVAPLVAAQVVAGDLNSGPTEAPATRLGSAGFLDAWATTAGGAAGFTYPTPTPTERIDYVFVKGLVPQQPQLEFTAPVVSDHLGVSARLVVP